METKDYNKEIKLKLDISLGYLYFIDKKHPLAYKNTGKVYYHRHVKSIEIGRWLTKDEHVHHIDENKINNNIENLDILNSRDHMLKHQIERGFNIKHIEKCIVCDNEFETYTSKYCSNKCVGFGSRKFNIDKETLEKLVWKYPTTEVAKMYNVSDNAIGKRCKKFGINKPPRGYWEKIYHKS